MEAIDKDYLSPIPAEPHLQRQPLIHVGFRPNTNHPGFLYLPILFGKGLFIFIQANQMARNAK